MRVADDGTPTRVMTTTRWIPDKGESGRRYFSAAFAVHEDVLIGIDYRPLADKVAGLATWRIFDETATLPGFVRATTKGDFTEHGEEVNSQSISAVLAKALPSWNGIIFVSCAGAAHLFELDDTRFVVGASLRQDRMSLPHRWSASNHHLSASYDLNEQVGLSFIARGIRYPGVGLRWRF